MAYIIFLCHYNIFQRNGTKVECDSVKLECKDKHDCGSVYVNLRYDMACGKHTLELVPSQLRNGGTNFWLNNLAYYLPYRYDSVLLLYRDLQAQMMLYKCLHRLKKFSLRLRKPVIQRCSACLSHGSKLQMAGNSFCYALSLRVNHNEIGKLVAQWR
jgi:hypothetical protein